MANHKSSAAQAIKDMLELGINVSFLTGHIKEVHMLNVEIGIITREEVRKVERHEPIRVYKPKPAPKPQHVYNRRVIINIDGTVSIEFEEWDYK